MNFMPILYLLCGVVRPVLGSVTSTYLFAAGEDQTPSPWRHRRGVLISGGTLLLDLLGEELCLGALHRLCARIVAQPHMQR